MSKSLIVGYGNPDRQDDGVAWHILQILGRRFGRIGQGSSADDITDLDLGELQARGGAPDLLGALQLMPEIAETLAAYDRVCFVDAHTGAYPQDINVAPLEAHYQSSPFTHHLTPETCLELTRAAYGRAPAALAVSVRGYQFGFSHHLSPQTAALAEEAAGRIADWITE